VSDGLDARSVRYYQTIGLLDRPLRYDGRTAIYGVRHLHQLVCVRALQAQGLSLSQVQRALSGATDAQLAAAVADALGQAAPAPAPRPEPRALRAVALAPGVIVTIDPSQCADPDAVIAALYRTLHPQESTP
jgi:DNA-binding transcriptional MerR regulator